MDNIRFYQRPVHSPYQKKSKQAVTAISKSIGIVVDDLDLRAGMVASKKASHMAEYSLEYESSWSP